MEATYPRTPNQSSNGLARAGAGFIRALVRSCPFCGSRGIFKNWFSLKEQCPGCGSVFEPEDGYMLGSYVVNLGITALVGVLMAFYFVFGTDWSVTTIQIVAVSIVVGLPVFLYGHAQLIWICIDLIFNNTKKFDPARIRHS